MIIVITFSPKLCSISAIKSIYSLCRTVVSCLSCCFWMKEEHFSVSVNLVACQIESITSSYISLLLFFFSSLLLSKSRTPHHWGQLNIIWQVSCISQVVQLLVPSVCCDKVATHTTPINKTHHFDWLENWEKNKQKNSTAVVTTSIWNLIARYLIVK